MDVVETDQHKNLPCAPQKSHKTAKRTQNVNMKNKQKALQAIRRAEAELAFADPKRAAKLTNKIIKLKLSTDIWKS